MPQIYTSESVEDTNSFTAEFAANTNASGIRLNQRLRVKHIPSPNLNMLHFIKVNFEKPTNKYL